jgi:hypothetical protein
MTVFIRPAAFLLLGDGALDEDRSNLEYLYKPYKALGGNGTGESLYKSSSCKREHKKFPSQCEMSANAGGCDTGKDR